MEKTTPEVKSLLQEFVEIGKDFKRIFSTQKFSEFKLTDGSIVRVDTDAFSKGSKISVISEKGEVPLVDGKYSIVLQEGQEPVEFTVSSGFVTEFEAPAQAAAPAEGGAPDVAKMAQALEALMAKVAELEKKIGGGQAPSEEMANEVKAAVEQGKLFKSDIEALKNENAELKKINEAMFAAIEKATETPEPTHKPTTKFKKQEVTIGNYAAMSLEDKIKHLQTKK